MDRRKRNRVSLAASGIGKSQFRIPSLPRLLYICIYPSPQINNKAQDSVFVYKTTFPILDLSHTLLLHVIQYQGFLVLSQMETSPASDVIPNPASQSNADGEKPEIQKTSLKELGTESAETQDIDSEEYQYVTGFKLAIIMVSMTLIFFLVMLDLSIITTVSQEIMR